MGWDGGLKANEILNLSTISESYVVKNRSRILTLLNIPDPLRAAGGPGSSPPEAGAGAGAGAGARAGAGSSASSPLLSNGSCSASVYNERERRQMAVTDF